MTRRTVQNISARNGEAAYVRRAILAAEILFLGKWKVHILCAMRSGPVRLGQLARVVPGASKKMLTQNLRRLEADGIVTRKNMSDLVLHVEYEHDAATKESVCDLLDHLAKWGGLHFSNSERSTE